MDERFTLFAGIFSVMALSNAIVPVLTRYAPDSLWQGSIYAAYFLGAFATTLPAGILSDRYGRMPIVRVGLVITVVSGCLLAVIAAPVPVILLRCLEGAGAGFFVAAAMAHVNSRPDHARMSGIFMAMLNAGLVVGLILSGWLAVNFSMPASGIIVFSVLTALATIASIGVSASRLTPVPTENRIFIPLLRDYRWLWYSTIILVGITGVLTSLYPKFSGLPPDILGIWIAGMSIATIVTVLVISRMQFLPVPVIRWAAILMIGGVMISYITPLGFIIIGSIAGVVMIAQMAFLAEVHGHQGTAMGLFSTTSYLGMTILPVLIGIVADRAGFFSAFLCTAVLAGTVAMTIGWCGCRSFGAGG
jgi:MFS family permease